MSVIDRILADRKDATRTVVLYLDGEAWSESIILRDRIAALRATEPRGLVSEVPGLERELSELLDELEASKVEVTFTALPEAKYQALLDAHPPKDDQWQWDPELFPTALIAAACVEVAQGDDTEPGMTIEQANQLRGVLPHKEWEELFAGAWMVQQERPRPFTYAATRRTSVGELNSSIASSLASLTPGS